VHAVDATGVHPLLLAIGSERYVPYEQLERPAELLTQASAILGQGQMSLAKYLWIVNEADAPGLDIHDAGAFIAHVLERFDPRRDLHFHTETTIDTLDYSGGALNQGSKLVIAAVGAKKRELPRVLPPMLGLPDGVSEPRLCLPGVVTLKARAFEADASGEDAWLPRLCDALGGSGALASFPLIVLCDDSDECARTLESFLWVTFTRSDPARDVHGVRSFVRRKHWGAEGSLVIDARQKPHHAPPLVEDPAVSARVDALAARGGPLFGLY
jgi:4-hydroxy-3-polyprenylbenzoate decarboxylase